MTHSGIIKSYEVIKALADENSIIELNNNWENSVTTCLTKISITDPETLIKVLRNVKL
ncbi:MAG: hypothetical protein ACJAX4_002594 [Clostridium sp.]|jgi:hypothetical protein